MTRLTIIERTLRFCPNCKHNTQPVWNEPCGSCQLIHKGGTDMTNFELKEDLK